MNIGLVDVDGHNFPNLALMKLSAWHKSKGDEVERADMFGSYDIVYMSKVFTFTAEDYMCYNTDTIQKGGTGYKNYSTVLPKEIEHIYPDYSLYNTDYAIGFATRGCPNKCPWCVVPKKEGNIRPNAEIKEFWNGQRNLVLLDNNILAHEFGLQQLEETARLGIHIDCNQGLDARIIAKDVEIQKLLAKNKWNKYIRLACDKKSQMESVEIAINKIREYAGRNIPFFVYTLITDDLQDAIDRIYFIRKMKYVDPFAQPYRDFETNTEPPIEQKRLARWCNMRAIFRTVEWKDYKYNKALL
jgi:hypothetical protein